MTNPDSDRVEAPITNEELYVKSTKQSVLIVQTGGLVIATLAVGFQFAGYSLGSTAMLLVGVALFGVGQAIWERSWLTTLYELVSRNDVDETVDELEARLETPARADGGEDDVE